MAEASRTGFSPVRAVHLHASRFCNLACRHCYSHSGPDERDALAAPVVIDALEALRDEGYDVLSLSGGEPLLYRDLRPVVEAARDLGYHVNLVTNGAPLGGKVLDWVLSHVDLVAVSLDGAPETHNDIRRDPRAFARGERAVDRLAASGAAFGIAYCVSRESLPDLPWAAEWAEAKGAAMLQVHPFAATGRGADLGDRLGLSAADVARAYTVATLLDSPALPIQLDLVPVDAARQRRQDYAAVASGDAHARPFSDLVTPLVIDETGWMAPLCYGMAPGFGIGSVHDGVGTVLARYREENLPELAALLDTAFDRLGRDGAAFVDWFYHLVETSRALAPVAA